MKQLIEQLQASGLLMVDYSVAHLFAYLGQADAAALWLEKTYDRRDPLLNRR